MRSRHAASRARARSQPTRAARIDRSLWTTKAVRAWIEEAFDTLRRLPGEPGPQGYGPAQWPEIVRSFHEAYGYGDVRVKRPAPPAKAIDRCFFVFDHWLPALDCDERRVAESMGFQDPKWKACQRIGCSRATLWRREQAVLRKLAAMLNRGMIKAPSLR